MKEEALAQSDPVEKASVLNRALKPLRKELEALRAQDSLDGFGLYLLGLVLKHLDQPSASREVRTATVPCRTVTLLPSCTVAFTTPWVTSFARILSLSRGWRGGCGVKKQ